MHKYMAIAILRSSPLSYLLDHEIKYTIKQKYLLLIYLKQEKIGAYD